MAYSFVSGLPGGWQETQLVKLGDLNLITRVSGDAIWGCAPAGLWRSPATHGELSARRGLGRPPLHPHVEERPPVHPHVEKAEQWSGSARAGVAPRC